MAATAIANYILPPIPDFSFPPLPAIQDPQLRKTAVTHASHHGKQRKAMSLDDDNVWDDYEKLEFVGDGLIHASITTLLNKLYPNLRQGPSTKLKSLLVNNNTFAQLAHFYRMQNDLIAHPSQIAVLRNQVSTKSALFEAFVAALYLSTIKYGVPGQLPPSPPQSPGNALHFERDEHRRNRGATEGEAFEYVTRWLHEVFTPIAHWAIEKLREEEKRWGRIGSGRETMDEKTRELDEDERARGATMALNQWYMQNYGKQPGYQESGPELGPHTVVCTVLGKQGEEIRGTATRSTKKAAKQIAAYEVCVQLGLMP